MLNTLHPFRLVLMAVVGWMNQEQQHAIQYLRLDVLYQREEREWMRLGRFSSAQEKRLERGGHVQGKPTGRKRRAAPRV